VRSKITNRPSARRSRREAGSNRGAGHETAPGRGTIPGTRIAPETGLPTIAPGRSAEAMADSTSLRSVSVCISAASTFSAFTGAPLSIWAIRASITAGIRS
jgi:hypothetical protein